MVASVVAATLRVLIRRALSERLNGAFFRALFATCAAVFVVPAQAGACRLALVLAFDVSASVDAQEYRLQSEGTAVALLSPEVRRLLLDQGSPVAIAVMLWSGPAHQTIVADWTMIDSPATLEALAARIAGFARPPGDGRTAVGAAMLGAGRLLGRAPDCDAATLDIAGDGENNAGPEPAPLRGRPPLAGVGINALAIGGDLPMDHGGPADEGGRLSGWFTAHVLHGPGAFVERADDYRDLARAMRRKLVRELSPALIGALSAR